MKRFALILLIVPLFFACNPSDNSTTLSGTVENHNERFILIGGPDRMIDTAYLQENGSFIYELEEIEENTYYYITTSKTASSFIMSPGYKAVVHFDATNIMNTIKYEGDGADINNYLVAKSNNPDFKRPGAEMYKLDYPAYKAWADENLNAQNDLLKRTVKENPENEFWKTEEGDILFNWASQLGMYSIYYKRYGETPSVILPDDYEDYKKQLVYNEPAYIKSRAFVTYLQSEIPVKARMDNEGTDIDYSLGVMKTAAGMITNQEVLDHFSAQFLKNQMSREKLKVLEPAISVFKDRCNTQNAMAYFQEAYDGYLKVSEGQPAFDFLGEDLEGNKVKLSDFAGKYVYVDVWATWCAPCKREIPFLKKMEADYHGRNIVFLSYSIDSDKEAWLKFVPENELGGVQLIGEADWKSAMPVYYKVSGVPTFMFFSPDGKIIDANMTRPSNQATRDKFETYSDL